MVESKGPIKEPIHVIARMIHLSEWASRGVIDIKVRERGNQVSLVSTYRGPELITRIEKMPGGQKAAAASETMGTSTIGGSDAASS
jgi:uncharacterized lipoprotein